MVRLLKGSKRQINYLVNKEYARLSRSAKPNERAKLKRAIKSSIINQLR
jgi:hypothetical protein